MWGGYGCVQVYLCVWKPEVEVWSGPFTEPGAHWLPRLASYRKALAFSCLCFPCSEITDTCCPTQRVTWVLEIQMQVLMLIHQAVCQLSYRLSSGNIYLFFKEIISKLLFLLDTILNTGNCA